MKLLEAGKLNTFQRF